MRLISVFHPNTLWSKVKCVIFTLAAFFFCTLSSICSLASPMGFSNFSLLNEPPRILWQWPWREFTSVSVSLFACDSSFIVLLLTWSFFLKLQAHVLTTCLVGWFFSLSRFPDEAGVVLPVTFMVPVKATVGSTRPSLPVPFMILGWSEFLFCIFFLVQGKYELSFKLWQGNLFLYASGSISIKCNHFPNRIV